MQTLKLRPFDRDILHRRRRHCWLSFPEINNTSICHIQYEDRKKCSIKRGMKLEKVIRS